MEECRQLMETEFDAFEENAGKKYALLHGNRLTYYCLPLLKKRFEHKSLRGYYMMKVAQYIAYGKGANEEKKAREIGVKMGFVAEVIIVIQYLHNQILDAKAGVTTQERISQNLLASNIMRELLFDYVYHNLQSIDKDVANIANADRKRASYLVDAVAQMLMYVDLGQMLEMDYGHYGAYKNASVPDYADSELNSYIKQHNKIIKKQIAAISSEMRAKERFVDLYFRRQFLTNGALFLLMTKHLCKILKCSTERQTELTRFGVTYSTALQLVNDVADTVPSHHQQATLGKDANDAFSDLRNSNITLLYAYHLHKGSGHLVKDYLDNPQEEKKIITNFQTQLYQELVDSGAIDKCVKWGRNLATMARNSLSPTNSATEMLCNMTEIADWNKYYKIIYTKK